MKAMILAAGLGSRLLTLTSNKPKALIEVAGRPVIDHVIQKLIKIGITEIVINLHYYPEQITSYLANQNYPCNFQFSFEEELLDTGGAIKKAQSLFNSTEDFLLHNCDILSDFKIENLIAEHQKCQSLATLAVSKNKSPRFLWFNKKMELVGWENKNTQFKELITTADDSLVPFDYNCMTIFNTKIFSYFDQLPDKFSIFHLLLLAIKEKQIVKGFDIKKSYWIDIGTPEDLALANKHYSI